jgi:hypothetical protein
MNFYEDMNIFSYWQILSCLFFYNSAEEFGINLKLYFLKPKGPNLMRKRPKEVILSIATIEII